MNRTSTPGWQDVFDLVLNAFFPLRCGGCGELGHPVFCERCTLQLRPLRAPMCGICGCPFDPLAFSGALCAQCRARRPQVEAARAAFVFEGPMRQAIHRLKYDRHFAYAKRLAPILEQKWARDELLKDFRPDWIVAVPLHSSRHRARGFNQSQLIANELAHLREVPRFEGLVRTRKTPSQVGLDAQNRRRNVRAAFEVRVSRSTQIQGKSLLLIDDVFTTGATLDECTRALKKAGAIEVFALTLARQSSPSEPVVSPLDWRTLTTW